MPEGASQRIDRAAASRGAVALQKSKADDARRGRLSRWFSDGQAKAKDRGATGSCGWPTDDGAGAGLGEA
ncbi:MAG TPA: hypothetical protein VGP04_04755 [Pseudonocardiaceae bacterium]|jgi:hypothetical protein|nr:hypothetical protein [Pseudonocardiaceae bacterium]